MRTIIAGSRGIVHYPIVEQAVAFSGFTITEVVDGCARGVDTLGRQWAVNHNIPAKEFPADWKTHGKAAGPIRNQQMADYAEALIAVMWHTGSPGTVDMIKRATKRGLKVSIVRVDTNDPYMRKMNNLP